MVNARSIGSLFPLVLLVFALALSLAGAVVAQDEFLDPYSDKWFQAEIDKLNTTSPMGTLVAPPSDLPPLPNVPATYCTEEERQDFETNKLKPAFEALQKAYREVASYHRALGILRDEAKSRYESQKKHSEDFPGLWKSDRAKVFLQLLKFRWDDLTRLEADYTKVFEAVSKRYTELRAPALEYRKTVECSPPPPYEIMYPAIADSFCTEADRQAAIDLLEPVVDAAREGANRLNEYWRDLIRRQERSTDKKLKDSFTTRIEEARQLASSAQKTADELSALLQKVRTAELQCMDPCLVGRWNGPGLTVTFDESGLQTVDYKDAHPEGVDGVKWTGQGSNVITAADGVARVKEERPGTVNYVIDESPQPLGTYIGYGGLGAVPGDNAYQCTATQLTYQGSTRADRQANITISLAK